MCYLESSCSSGESYREYNVCTFRLHKEEEEKKFVGLSAFLLELEFMLLNQNFHQNQPISPFFNAQFTKISVCVFHIPMGIVPDFYYNWSALSFICQ